jgi:hypothetical protein
MDRIIIFMRVGTWVNVTHCGVTDGREFTDLVFRIPNEKKTFVCGEIWIR